MMESASKVTTDHPCNSTCSSAGSNETLLYNSTISLHHFNKALLGVSLGSLSLLTVIMNILVLYAVKKEKTLHTVGNLYIVSLSVADLIVGATVMPLNLVYLLEDEWKLGRIVCQFWLIMDYVASTASIFSLFILCLDRYRSVRQPLKYLKYRTRGKASVMITGAWLLSMTWILPILGWRSFTHVQLKPEMENKCDTDFRFVTWFKVITAVFNFYVPSILMLWFYTRIYLAVRQHIRERERIINPVDSFGDNGPHNAQTLENDVYQCRRDNMASSEYSHQESLVDHYTLEKPYYSNVKNEREEINSELDKINICHSSLSRTTELTDSAKYENGECLSPQQVKSDSDASLSVSPVGIQHSEDNNVEKLFVSVTDCHVAVPNSVAGVCEITQISDVERYTTMLRHNNEFNPSLALSWPEEGDTKLDGANGLTLKHTWQRFCEHSRQRIHSLQIRKEHKAAKQLGCIIAAFMMCWIPYFIAFMVMAFCQTCVLHDLHMFTIWLGYMNSTLNPFIYPLCNENFKRVFKSILNIHS
ncbi:histamine H1 receptor [Osmerus eperlanus]|uniref:histamine H1 receptor n=1 Tax=Osmerus eperlanus TaxID=29151 RepID=UPI002E11D487